MAAVLPLLNFSAKTSRRLAIGMIITAWTIVVASTIDPLFPNARGLELTGESNMMNDIAFLLFVVGIGIVIVIMAKVASHCLLSSD
jgi:multisubunit Na+/H+ antiporter MnhB subunit